MTTDTANHDKMRGGVRRRGTRGKWSYTINLGLQATQRCVACGHREWLGHKPLTACPACDGALRDTHERRQEQRGGFGTRKAAEHARHEALADLGKGTHVVPERLTLREYLEDRWLPGLEVSDLRPTTMDGYRSHVRLHFAGGPFGDLLLQELTRDQIAAHYAALATHGRRDGCKKPLSPLTVRHIHTTLHSALRAAVEAHLLAYNPADGIRLSHGQAAPRAAWESSQLREFLQATKEDRPWPLWVFLATTGCRRGEALGLAWDDVDFTRGTVSIRRTLLEYRRGTIEGTPKTRAGRRTIALDPPTVRALERELRVQRQEKALLGERWVDSGFVFVSEDGQALHPAAATLIFAAAVKRSGLPRITLHGLRHSFATIALNERHAPVGQVSARLGHRDASVTLAIYQHAIPKQDEVLAADFAKTVVPEG